MIVNSHTINPFGITASVINEYSIGQHINISIDCTASASLVNKSIYFNPALFTSAIDNLTDVPTAGYQYDAPGVITFATPYDMDIINCGTGYNTGDNYAATITFSTNTDFVINYDFFLTADVDGFMQCGSTPNGYRFLKDNFDNPVILNNSYADIYTTDRRTKFHIGADDGVSYEYINHGITWTSRFYEKGLYDGTAEFTNWTWVISRDSVAVSNFSPYTDTIFTAAVDYAGTPTDKIQLLLIREDDTNSGQNYLDDLELNGTLLDTAVLNSIASGVPAGAIISGSNLTNVGGNTWVFSCTIDNTYFVADGFYRLLVVYRDEVTELTNSFITSSIPASAPPDGCKPAIVGQIITYNNNSAGNYIKTTVCDRVKTQIDVSRTDFATCLTNLGFLGNYDDYFSKYTIKISDSATGTVMKTVTSNFSTILTPGMTSDQIGSNQRYCYEFRIPDSWAGNEYWIEHQVFMYYADSTPWTDKLIFKQKLCVQDYDENLDPVDQLMIDAYLTDSVGNPISTICQEDDFCVLYEQKPGTDHSVIGLVKRGGVQEEDPYTGYLDQQENDIITSVDTAFGGDNLAEMCIDKGELVDGATYSFCAIAKPEILVYVPIFSKATLADSDMNAVRLYDYTSTDSLGYVIGNNPTVYHLWEIYELGTPANIIAHVEGYSLDPITVTMAGGYSSAFSGIACDFTMNKQQIAIARGEAEGFPYGGTAIQYGVTHSITYGASNDSNILSIGIKWRLTMDDSHQDSGGGAPYILLDPPIGGPALSTYPGVAEGSGWRNLDFNGDTVYVIDYTIAGVPTAVTYNPYGPTSTAQFVSLNLANDMPSFGFSVGQPLPSLTDGTDHKGDYITSSWTDQDLTQIRIGRIDSLLNSYSINFSLVQTIKV